MEKPKPGSPWRLRCGDKHESAVFRRLRSSTNPWVKRDGDAEASLRCGECFKMNKTQITTLDEAWKYDLRSDLRVSLLINPASFRHGKSSEQVQNEWTQLWLLDSFFPLQGMDVITEMTWRFSQTSFWTGSNISAVSELDRKESRSVELFSQPAESWSGRWR